MNRYHQLLGVSEQASRAELKAAFRRLARRYHPDISSEENAKEKFIEVVAAYRSLLSETKGDSASIFKKTSVKSGTVFTAAPPSERQQANRQRSRHRNESGGTREKPQDSKPHQCHNEAAAAQPSTGKDCHIDVYVSVEELYWGVELKINPAASCLGRRSKKDWRHSGLLNVKIPRGTRNGECVRVNATEQIYLTVKLKPHTRYEVSGENLYVDMPLSRWEAEQGAVIDIVTPGGRVEVDVPAGIASGQSVRVPNHGLPLPDSSSSLHRSPSFQHSRQGDLFAVARLVNIKARAEKLHKWPNVPHADLIRWRTAGNRGGRTIDIRI